MIFESYIYKDELLKISKRMRKRLSQKRWSDHSLFLLEKDIFLGFFIIRKLIEAKTKVSDVNAEMLLDLNYYSPTGKKPTLRNHYDFNELYNLEKATQCKKKIRDVCGDLIHSYILQFLLPASVNDTSDFLIYFNSFKTREKGLYSFKLIDFVEALEVFGNDYLSCGAWVFDQDTNDYIFSNGVSSSDLADPINTTNRKRDS